MLRRVFGFLLLLVSLGLTLPYLVVLSRTFPLYALAGGVVFWCYVLRSRLRRGPARPEEFAPDVR